jgi:uncharacterized membrane protein
MHAMPTRPRITPPTSRLDGVLTLAGAAMVAGMWVYAAMVIGTLPDRIPTHFDIRGMPDAWGPARSILALPAVATGVFVVLGVVGRIPAWNWNLPVRVTAENAARVYASARRMLGVLGVETTLVFAVILAQTVLAARGGQGLHVGVTFGVAGLIPATVIGWILRLRWLGRSRDAAP